MSKLIENLVDNNFTDSPSHVLPVYIAKLLRPTSNDKLPVPLGLHEVLKRFALEPGFEHMQTESFG
jgi:hypothetical protein